MNKDDLFLERIGLDDTEAIRFIYLCQINETEKDKTTFLPVYNQIIDFDEQRFQEFIPSFQEILQENCVYYCIKNQSQYLGFLQLRDYNPRNRSAEIGFYFPKENRYKGYGKILLELFLNTVFHNSFFWPIYKIHAETCENNVGSKKLFEKFGFHLDGIIRDHYWFEEEKYDQLIFSILKSEFNV